MATNSLYINKIYILLFLSSSWPGNLFLACSLLFSCVCAVLLLMARGCLSVRMCVSVRSAQWWPACMLQSSTCVRSPRTSARPASSARWGGSCSAGSSAARLPRPLPHLRVLTRATCPCSSATCCGLQTRVSTLISILTKLALHVQILGLD